MCGCGFCPAYPFKTSVSLRFSVINHVVSNCINMINFLDIFHGKKLKFMCLITYDI